MKPYTTYKDSGKPCAKTLLHDLRRHRFVHGVFGSWITQTPEHYILNPKTLHPKTLNPKPQNPAKSRALAKAHRSNNTLNPKSENHEPRNPKTLSWDPLGF